MKRAFVITVELEQGENDLEVAQDLAEAVEGDGYKVLSVNPFGGSAETVSNEPTPTQSTDIINDVTLI